MIHTDSLYALNFLAWLPHFRGDQFLFVRNEALPRDAAQATALQRALATFLGLPPPAADRGKLCLNANFVTNKGKVVRAHNATIAEVKGTLAASKEGREVKAFFDAHSFWGSEAFNVPREQRYTLLGVDALTGRLSSLLVTRIRKALPAIKYELQNQKKEAEQEYKRLGGDNAPDDPIKMRAALVDVVTRYAALMRQSARGNYGHTLLAQNPNLRLFGRHQVVFKDLKDSARRAASESTQNRNRDHPAPSLMETSRVDAAREPENRGNTRNRRYAGFLRLVRRERQDGLQRGHVRAVSRREDPGRRVQHRP